MTIVTVSQHRSLAPNCFSLFHWARRKNKNNTLYEKKRAFITLAPNCSGKTKTTHSTKMCIHHRFQRRHKTELSWGVGRHQHCQTLALVSCPNWRQLGRSGRREGITSSGIWEEEDEKLTHQKNKRVLHGGFVAFHVTVVLGWPRLG
jgi:hypothetical protein